MIEEEIYILETNTKQIEEKLSYKKNNKRSIFISEKITGYLTLKKFKTNKT